ncbi:hypothetical protein V6N13_076040 [Hibiscus sabdariffa]
MVGVWSPWTCSLGMYIPVSLSFFVQVPPQGLYGLFYTRLRYQGATLTACNQKFATSQSHMAWITQEYVTCMLGMAIHVIWLCHGGLLVDKPHRPVKDDKINNQHQLISTYGYFTATRAGKLPSAEYISQRTPV